MTELNHSTHVVPKQTPTDWAKRVGNDLAVITRQILEASSIEDPTARAERIGMLIGKQKKLMSALEGKFAQYGQRVTDCYNAVVEKVEKNELPMNIGNLGLRLNNLGSLHHALETYRVQGES